MPENLILCFDLCKDKDMRLKRPASDYSNALVGARPSTSNFRRSGWGKFSIMIFIAIFYNIKFLTF